MKDCTKQFFFKGISGKKIEADFNGGEIRSDAGLPSSWRLKKSLSL
ncbi:MAG: hypothetical protein J7L26_12145 [Candidatus Aminicenantes bacterium]|nr:hypothetical protein [Candidatus Aminicenantes bacterium]